MADLGLRERLQPSLIDRLIDEERLLTLFELTFARARLQAVGILERELRAVLLAQGLSAGPPAEPEEEEEEGGRLRLRFWAPTGRVGTAQLNALVIRPPGAPEGIALQQLCEIGARNVTNETAESPDQRLAIAHRLREIVSRDIGLLLNASPMETVVDLEGLPRVRQSVLNFGLPSPTGRYASSVSRQELASQIEAVIRCFEPRLSRVRVTPDTEREQAEVHEVSLRIDAELWGQPAPFQVVLHTSIDVESGKASVSDLGSR
jgi:type VI secretion system protein ImpF